jgi:hypothetical protein
MSRKALKTSNKTFIPFKIKTPKVVEKEIFPYFYVTISIWLQVLKKKFKRQVQRRLWRFLNSDGFIQKLKFSVFCLVFVLFCVGYVNCEGNLGTKTIPKPQKPRENFKVNPQKSPKVINTPTWANTSDEQSINVMASALSAAIQKLYVESFHEVEFLVYGKPTPHNRDVLDKVLKQCGANVVIKYHENTRDPVVFSKSAVIFVSSVDDINGLNHRATLNNTLPVAFKFLVYSQNLDWKRLRNQEYGKILGRFGGQTQSILVYEYFLVDSDLWNFRYLTPDSCQEPKFIKIDIFDANSMRWLHDLKHHRFNRDFNGCLLTFSVVFGSFFHFTNTADNKRVLSLTNTTAIRSLLETINSRDTTRYEGLFFEVIETMARYGNFTANYQLMWSGFISRKNVIVSPPRFMPYIMRNAFHVGFGVATPFINVDTINVITPSPFYSNYEKLFFPFDFTTWMMLLVSLVVALTTIAVVNQMPKSRSAKKLLDRNCPKLDSNQRLPIAGRILYH